MEQGEEIKNGSGIELKGIAAENEPDTIVVSCKGSMVIE